MAHFVRKLIFILLVLQGVQLNATHLLGGFLSYECVGPVPNSNQVEYIIKGVFFRDSTNVRIRMGGATLENPLEVTLFNHTTGSTSIISMNQDSLVLFVDSAENLCVLQSTPTIIQKGYYTATVFLRRDNKHTVAWRRCCRNRPVNIVNSIANGGVGSGSTFLIDIPPYNLRNRCNSSPELNLEQPFSFCANVNLNLDLSASDADNDSLEYELCAPLDFRRVIGVGPFTQVPVDTTNPAYGPVTFIAPMSATNPILSVPGSPITINPTTGLLTGSPRVTGKYVVGFCVKEYDRATGQLLTTTIRDIQVEIFDCILSLSSAIQDQQVFCDGLSVKFVNETSSNVDSSRIPYKWDFGVPNTLADTSREFEPTFVFPSPGTYNITLIANPDNPDCRDTSVEVFNLPPVVTPVLSSNGVNLCDDNNAVDFTAVGSFQSNALFRWNFGPNASIVSSTSQTVNGVSFPGQGSYPIELIIDQDVCSDTLTDIIDIFNNPTLDFSVNDAEGCAPHDVRFTSSPFLSGNGTATYEWDFGDGSASTIQNTLPNPTHTYQNDGIYEVKLIMRTQGDCKDTVELTKPNLVSVGDQFSADSVGFTFTNGQGCSPLPVQFTNTSFFNGTANFFWDFGDGSTSTEVNPLHEYTADGTYDVSLVMTKTSGCIGTFSFVSDDAVRVSLDFSKNEVGFIVSETEGCAPFEVRFTDTSFFEGAAEFEWFFGDGNTSNLQNPVHVYEEDGVFDVRLILTTTEKCIETIDTTKPNLIETDLQFSDNMVNFDFFPKEGCPPLTVQFSDSSFSRGNIEYYWDFADGGLSNDQNPTNVYQDTGMYDVSLLIITSERCTDTLDTLLGKSVRVLPQPVAQINASDSALSLKEAMFNFNNSGSEFVTESKYLINGMEVAQSEIFNFQFTDTGHFQVSYVASNSIDCTDTSTVEIFVFDEFEFIIPNVFTPNGDAINDQFKMQACGIYEYQIEVYNRFGEQVFQSNNLNINWDGRIAGKLAKSGTYYYTIRIMDFRGEFLNYNGNVLLIRD